jgi:hypothetical protein
MTRSGQRGARILLPTLILLGIVLGSAIRSVWAIDPDASLYVGLGRSLAAGDGYALDGVPHTKYPPGLPLLLAGLTMVADAEAYALFHAGLVLALLVAAGLAGLVTRRLGYPPAVVLASVLAVACSQALFDLSVVYLRTEPLYMALSLAALLAIWRAQAPRSGAAAVGAAAALVVAAISVRLAGVTLLVVPAWALLQRSASRDRLAVGSSALPGHALRRGRAALILLAGLCAIGAWQVRAAAAAASHPDAIDYSAEFRAAEPRDLSKVVRIDMPPLDAHSLAQRVAGNADVMTRAMAVLLTNVDRAGARRPVGLLLTLLIAVGLYSMAGSPGPRRDAALYVLATLGLYLVWPFNQQERFYVPLLPLLVLMAGEGLRRAWALAGRLVARPGGRAAVLLGGALILLLLAVQRSDYPVLLGRWSWSYAALLGTGLVGWIAVAAATRARSLPVLRPGLALAAAAVWLVPFAHLRWVEWPARVAAFEEHRRAQPQRGALARIDVDVRLERIAVFLRDETPADTLVMTDVPRMLQVMSGRRCVPFVYRVQPPEVLAGDADLLFYSREIPEAAAVMDAVAPGLQPALELEPLFDGVRSVTPTVYKAR